MRGINTLFINQATMIEAMQLYFDQQLSTKQKVIGIELDKDTVYGQPSGFVVSFSDEEVLP